MSLIYHVSGKPLPGKQKSMLSQFRTGAGIMSRLGSLETPLGSTISSNSSQNHPLIISEHSKSPPIHPQITPQNTSK